jgi:hypothetical protein
MFLTGILPAASRENVPVGGTFSRLEVDGRGGDVPQSDEG